MSREQPINETHVLSHSIEQLYVHTPVAKKTMIERCDSQTGFGDVSVPLSPPQTTDIRQKRERSESLMLCHTSEPLVTKRRLRSRSRLGLDPEMAEDLASSLISPPCSSKPRERTHSRSLCPFPSENLACHSKVLGKHLVVNTQSSVFMTPYTEERKPLQNRDVNAANEIGFDCSDGLRVDQRILRRDSEDSSDSGSDNEPAECFQDKTRTKLTFDEELEHPTPGRDINIVYNSEKIIGKRIGKKKIDFIKELVHLNCEEICKKIFCYLEPKNLQRVASVSKLWRKICKKDRVASPRLDEFIHGRKQYVVWKGKENLGYSSKFDHKVPQRPPFSAKSSNTIWTPSQRKSSSEKAALEQVKTDIMATYERMKCPSCGSPSRKLENEICECDKCEEKFCSVCHHRADKNHRTGKCGIKVNKSKKGKGKEAIGSKQSKSRLKRY